MVIEDEFPFKHTCNVFNYAVLPSGKISLHCALCKKLFAVLDININEFGLNVKKEKIYPSPENAQYNLFNLQMWV